MGLDKFIRQKAVFLRQGVGGEPQVRLEKQVGANYTRSCITCLSLFCFNHYQFHHSGTLGVPSTILRSCVSILLLVTAEMQLLGNYLKNKLDHVPNIIEEAIYKKTYTL